MGNAISSCNPLSCQLADISPTPAPPCFSLCCPSRLLVSVMLPPANSFVTLILFTPFLPSPLHPPCWSLPLAMAGPTRSRRQDEFQPGTEQGGVDVTSSGDPAQGWVRGDVGAVLAGPEQGQSSGFAPSEPCHCEPGPQGRALRQAGVNRGKGWWWQRPPCRAAQSFVASSRRKQALLARLLVLGIFKNFWQPILVVQPLSCQNG